MEQDSKIPSVVIRKSFLLKLVGPEAEDLIKNPRPILWCNDGLYGWVRYERVKNAANTAKNAKIAAENNNRKFVPVLTFNWGGCGSDAKQMAQAIVALKEKCQKCNNDTA